jgi:hypothetical protein
MKAGMIIRSKSKHHDQRWFIKKEGDIKRTTQTTVTMVKGYRLAPLDNLGWGFWVTEDQLHKRFEEVEETVKNCPSK